VLKIEDDIIHVYREEGGDWEIRGHKNLEVSYHPEWKAKTQLLVAECKKGDTVIGYRLLVIGIDAPYKKNIYHDAIMYSIADAFRRTLWGSDQPSPTTSLEWDSLKRGCEND
jgi:hypothetical protein